MEELTLNEKLNCLYLDFLMLKDGDWIPDEHSVNASISMLESVAIDLNITLEDTRNEN